VSLPRYGRLHRRRSLKHGMESQRAGMPQTEREVSGSFRRREFVDGVVPYQPVCSTPVEGTVAREVTVTAPRVVRIGGW